jgi:S1-C subfamily serine protease
VEVISKAGLAYMEGDPNHPVEHFETALRLGGLNDEQEHYVELSLRCLSESDLFDSVPGVYLVTVEPFEAAARAGLKKGDVIVRYNSAVVNEPYELAATIAAARNVPSVAIQLIRDGKRLTEYIAGGKSLCATGTTLVYFAPSAL